jgi:hypothetical protein
MKGINAKVPLTMAGLLSENNHRDGVNMMTGKGP